MKRALMACLLAAPLGACATTSFAPPPVNPQLKANVDGVAGCQARAVPSEGTIGRNVDGAMTLTDNFIYAYRCAQRQLANGRQFFQVPAFLAAVAGLAGPTLGMSNDAVLLTGTGAGVLNAGNGYYAPKAKAGVVTSALRALVCIKTEAAGVSYFKTDKPKEAPSAQQQQQLLAALNELRREEAELRQEGVQGSDRGAALAANLARQREIARVLADAALEEVQEAASDSVYIDAEVQYFEMVSGALYSVESILAERLSDIGTTDTTELFAKLKELAKAHTDAENALKAAKPKPNGEEGVDTASLAPTTQRQLVKLENAVLQPKLQTCVLQARV